MKKVHYILIALLITFNYACKKDYLDVKKDTADVPVDALYTNYNYVQEVMWNAYSYLPDGFSNLDMEAATDNAEFTNVNSRSQYFNYGIWNQYFNPDNAWGNYFDGIRQANLYLKNKGRADLSYIKDRITSTDSTTYFQAKDNLRFMEGEAYFLKAFFYFELVKRYGGVPILEEPLNYNKPETWKGIQRNSLDECIKYIVALCDKAATILPADLSAYSWYLSGRATYGAIKSLKARVLLYAASPLYKDAGSTVTWEDAAKAAKDVIDLKAYSLDGTYANLFLENNATSSEAIFIRRIGNANWLEYSNFPIMFEKSNGNSITPSQNFVDEFEVLVKNSSGTVTGSEPFSWGNPAHAANPYANRDPRLAATVLYNNMSFKSNTIQTYIGGNSGLPKQNASKTGYYLSKWVNPTVDLVNNTSTVHTWLHFRYAEILLNYAEAMFNAYGAEGDPMGYGKTALQAINEVRNRNSVKMPLIAAGQLNQKAIEHERNIELGFEGHRFWDVRRWKKGSTYFKAPLNRIEITFDGAGKFTYTVKKLEDRVYEEKMNWYPIAQSEIVKTGWTQNSGW
jgi:starch-binding outer membrane protein, SusD/RagB family